MDQINLWRIALMNFGSGKMVWRGIGRLSRLNDGSDRRSELGKFKACRSNVVQGLRRLGRLNFRFTTTGGRFVHYARHYDIGLRGGAETGHGGCDKRK